MRGLANREKGGKQANGPVQNGGCGCRVRSLFNSLHYYTISQPPGIAVIDTTLHDTYRSYERGQV